MDKFIIICFFVQTFLCLVVMMTLFSGFWGDLYG